MTEIIDLLEKIQGSISKHYVHDGDYECDGCPWCWSVELMNLLKQPKCKTCGDKHKITKRELGIMMCYSCPECQQQIYLD